MNSSGKRRIVKDFENLPQVIEQMIKVHYPHGFARHLISYIDQTGKNVSALPFETEDTIYLVRMTVPEAKAIIARDDDYDEDGILRDDFEVDTDEESEKDTIPEEDLEADPEDDD